MALDFRIRDFRKSDIPQATKIVKDTIGKKDAVEARYDFSLKAVNHRFPKGKVVPVNETSYTFIKRKVATHKGKVIAIAGVYVLDTYDKGIAGIDWFAVARKYEHRGIGTALTNWMIDEARRNANKHLIVWSTDEAIRFYKGFGFKKSRMKIIPYEFYTLMEKKL